MNDAKQPRHNAKELEFNYIDDGIYIGTNMCCQIHFDEKLKQEGISKNISLEEERVDAPFGVESYLWLPTADHKPPSQSQIDYGVSAIEKLVSLNKKIYVHCKNGHGRSPTLVAAYLIKSKGMSDDEAISSIQKKRPSIYIEKTQKLALNDFSQKTTTSKNSIDNQSTR